MPEAARKRRDQWRFVGPVLRITAEAGWLTVLYSAAAVLVSPGPPLLGPIEMAAFVAAGVLIAALSRGSPQLGTLILIDAVVIAGILGWLADPAVRDQVVVDIWPGFGMHMAGWLAGLAVLRGATIDVGTQGTHETEILLRTSLPGVAIIWAVTTVLVRPVLWLSFAINAMWGTVLLIGAAVLSIGLSRLNVIHRDVEDTATRRGWLSAVTLIAIAVVPIAAPFVVLSGIPVAALLEPFAGPFEWLFGLLSVPLQIVVAILIEILRPWAGGVGELIDRLGENYGRRLRQQPDPGEASLMGTLLGIALVIITAIVVFVAVYTFARWLLMRRIADEKPLDPLGPTVERAIVRPPREPRAAAIRRVTRRGPMPDVVGAYVSTLDELERYPQYARGASETPAGHAGRMRRVAMPGVADLTRLAAGYQLARYGERAITRTENMRAVARFERIRRLVRGGSPGAATTD